MKSYKIIKEFHKKVKIECMCGSIYTTKKSFNIKNPCKCGGNNIIPEKETNYSFNIYKKRVLDTKFKHEAELTPSQFSHLIKQNCFYCYSEPREYSEGTLRNGIDRVDNNKGYTIDNVVTCCSTCNKMKGVLSKEEFLSHMRKINKEQVDRNQCSEVKIFYKDFKTGKFQPPHVVQVLLNSGTVTPEEVNYPIYESLVEFEYNYQCAKDWLRSCLNNTLGDKKTAKKVFEVTSLDTFLKWYGNYHITGNNDLNIISKELPDGTYGNLNKQQIIYRTELNNILEKKMEYMVRWDR